jgi:hypothetical protein
MQARRAGIHRRPQDLAFSDQIDKIAGRIGKPIEIVGNREVLDDIAFLCVDDTAIRFKPLSHAASPDGQFATLALRASRSHQGTGR